MNKKKVVKHLKSDIKTFHHEAAEDKKLIKALKKPKTVAKPVKKEKGKAKIKKVMHEFAEGELHSGSKKGPKVTNPKQAVAIAYSEAKRAKKKRK